MTKIKETKHYGKTDIDTPLTRSVRDIVPLMSEGVAYPRTKVDYGRPPLLERHHDTFVVLGDVPPDVLTLLRAGRRFTLETVYEGKDPVPVSQDLLIIDETKGPTEYRFTRKTRKPSAH